MELSKKYSKGFLKLIISDRVRACNVFAEIYRLHGKRIRKRDLTINCEEDIRMGDEYF